MINCFVLNCIGGMGVSAGYQDRESLEQNPAPPAHEGVEVESEIFEYLMHSKGWWVHASGYVCVWVGCSGVWVEHRPAAASAGGSGYRR